jgi:hypothetical protein
MDGLRRAAPDKIMIGPVFTTHALGDLRLILIIAVLDGRLHIVKNVHRSFRAGWQLRQDRDFEISRFRD